MWKNYVRVAITSLEGQGWNVRIFCLILNVFKTNSFKRGVNKIVCFHWKFDKVCDTKGAFINFNRLLQLIGPICSNVSSPSFSAKKYHTLFIKQWIRWFYMNIHVLEKSIRLLTLTLNTNTTAGYKGPSQQAQLYIHDSCVWYC